MQTTPVQSIISLSYLIFVTDSTRFIRSLELSFLFSVDCTCTINHVIVLSGFHHKWHTTRQVLIIKFRFRRRPNLYNMSHCCHVLCSSQTEPGLIGHYNSVSFSMWTTSVRLVIQLSYLVFITISTQSNQSQKFSIVFIIDCTCMISHIIIISCIRHKRHPIQSVKTSLVSFLDQNAPIRSIMSLSYLVFITKCSQLDRCRLFSINFSIYQTYRLVTSLFCLAFATDNTRSNRSRQFSIIFDINCTYMIGHVVVLSGFHDRRNLVRSVMTSQFHFRRRPHLYNQSHSSLYRTQSIGTNNSVSFLTQITPV